MKKSIVLVLFFVSWATAFGQSEQAEYLEAKRLFSEQQYSSAKAAFSTLTQSETFGRYASFYYALAAYQQGDLETAADMWRQILVQFPTWDKKSDVLFWLAHSQYEQKAFNGAIRFTEQLVEETGSNALKDQFYQKYLQPLPLEMVMSLYSNNQENRQLALILQKKLTEVPYADRDLLLINQLSIKWNFEYDEYSSIELPVIKKDTYDIAVLLPFLFESLDNTRLITQNSLVMDMYQGMLMAAEDLGRDAKPVRLLPFDTKRRVENAQLILETPGFEHVDLIVGPLYSQPNKVINDYSLEKQINTFNPISSNSDIVDTNPYSFLMRPSYETMALRIAEFASTENENPNVMIYYEQSERDSIFASVYKDAIEAAGFSVVRFQPINKDNAKAFLDTLAAQYDNYLTKEEADSIQQIPGRFVRNRRIRRDEMDRMRRDALFELPISLDDNGKRIVYFEKLFYMKPDSIGHILAATRSNLYANNLISAVETRGDSIKLYGYGDWIDFTMLSYNQLDRLGVALAHPEYIDESSYLHDDLRRRLIKKYKTNPSINHFRGYEIIWYTGRMLHLYGKYFQNGLREGLYLKGKAFEGFEYGAANDNQVVPIVRFKNSKLEVVNRDQYED